MDTAKITTIDPKAIVSVKFSGAFLGRLNKFLHDYSMSMGQEDFISSMMEIKNIYEETITLSDMSEKAYNLDTIITLIRCIEQEFKKEGKTSSEKIEYNLEESKKAEINDAVKEIMSNISDH